MKLADAFAKLIISEGDTLDLNPKDRGNWTGGVCNVGTLAGSKYGISAAAHPNVDIANLTAEDAMGIYQREYWEPIWGDQLPDVVAFELFDEAVNMGVSGAVKMVQGAVGVFKDGKMGPATFSALSAVDPSKLGVLMCASRLEFYTSLPNWPDESRGWARRVARDLRNL